MLKDLEIEHARRSFLEFVKYTKPDYEVNWHHKAMCEILEGFIHKRIKRLIIQAPPRSGKSELVSRRLPAYILGVNPDASIITASYGAELASMMNRDVQRIIDTQSYYDVFPNTTLNRSNVRTVSQGSALRNSDIFEIVGHRGVYKCAGVGGALTGMGGGFCLIDDPIKSKEDADSKVMREKVWDWYTSVLYTRLEKNGSILLTMCMTGDTKVLMANGKEKILSDIKIGDLISTYDNGKISTSIVRNWKCNGPDFVFMIKTSSGIVVKANKRHPFLIYKNGKLEWVRLKELRLNDKMICVTEHGKGKYVHSMDAIGLQNVKDFAVPIITKQDGQKATGRHRSIKSLVGPQGLKDTMALAKKTTMQCLLSKMGNVLSVICHRLKKMLGHIGMESYVSTMTTLQEKSGASCVTIAISQLDMEKQKKLFSQQLNICDFTLDSIVEIKSIGHEKVYDIQVDRTENFIANGLVSHNTRWHEDDLAGRLIKLAQTEADADKWEVITFPAILDEVTDNPLDPRELGQGLWENKFSLKTLHTMKASMGSRVWQALYQQRPTAPEGTIIKRDWLRFYRELPKLDKIILSWDMAFKESDSSDYVVGQVWGVKGSEYYLIDQVRDRMDFPKTIMAFKLLTKAYPEAAAKLVEAKANGQAVIDVLKKEISGIIPIDPKDSKESRLSAIAPLFEAGNIYYPENKSFTHDNIEELISFPKAPHDDTVDATSQAVAYLSKNKGSSFSIGVIKR